MNEIDFLKMLFNGYVQSYSNNRWHTKAKNAQMTQQELSYFSDLGTNLGFISMREYTESPPDNHIYKGKSFPRDLVWLIEGDKNNVFLHLERENSSSDVNDAFFGNRKLKDSALFRDDRFLLGVFGHVRPGIWEEAKLNITKDPEFKKRNILLIGFVGDKEDNADSVYGFIFSGNKCYQRLAIATRDKGGFWYLYFEPDSQWVNI
jgi:hypothetical protein